jgi:hypothetical protein
MSDPDYEKKRERVLKVDLAWGFNNNEELVWMAFRAWRDSGFVRKPTKAEAAALDDDWSDDLDIAYKLVQYAKDYPDNQRAMSSLHG